MRGTERVGISEQQYNLNAEGPVPQVALWTRCLLSLLLTERSWKPYRPPSRVSLFNNKQELYLEQFP